MPPVGVLRQPEPGYQLPGGGVSEDADMGARGTDRAGPGYGAQVTGVPCLGEYGREAKSRGLPCGIRSGYLAGLAKAKRGEKPVYR